MRQIGRLFHRSTRRGFTLLEVLLALTLLAGLLVALNMFVFSMAEIWGENRDKRLFNQHARAVTHHVEDILHEAVSGPGTSGITVSEVNLPTGGSEDRLVFTLPEGTRQMLWPDYPLPDVELSLGIGTKGGLVIGWRSRLEVRFNDDPPRELVVTPYVTAMSFDYYDATFKRWETDDELKPADQATGDVELPQRIRLHFQRGEETVDTIVTVPQKGEGATWY